MMVRSRLVVAAAIGAVGLVALVGPPSLANSSGRVTHHVAQHAVPAAKPAFAGGVARQAAPPALHPTLATNPNAHAVKALVPTLSTNPMAHAVSAARPAVAARANIHAVSALRPTLAASSASLTRAMPMSKQMLHMITMCGSEHV
jgi:hypothetical protein